MEISKDKIIVVNSWKTMSKEQWLIAKNIIYAQNLKFNEERRKSPPLKKVTFQKCLTLRSFEKSR